MDAPGRPPLPHTPSSSSSSSSSLHRCNNGIFGGGLGVQHQQRKRHTRKQGIVLVVVQWTVLVAAVLALNVGVANYRFLMANTTTLYTAYNTNNDNNSNKKNKNEAGNDHAFVLDELIQLPPPPPAPEELPQRDWRAEKDASSSSSKNNDAAQIDHSSDATSKEEEEYREEAILIEEGEEEISSSNFADEDIDRNSSTVERIGTLSAPPPSHNNNEGRTMGSNASNTTPTAATPPTATTGTARSSPTTTTSAACLLIKDDGDILNEWLAYHYHALDLRYLLVAVDPHSATSPTPIFNRWRQNTNLTITEWSDSDFMPRDFLTNGFHMSWKDMNGNAKESQWHEGHESKERVQADNLQVATHRFRQLTFLSACLRHMKENRKTWTFHVDTDEFIVVNPLLRNTTKQHVQDLPIETVEKPSSVLHLMETFRKHRALRKRFNYPCICLPRLLFGSVEESFPELDNASSASKLFNPMRFETLRWKYHTSYYDVERNAQPKVIVDVSAVPMTDQMFVEAFSIHRPSAKLCRGIDGISMDHLQRYPISANHYTGSWERYYLSKNDTRRSQRAYNFKSNVSNGYDDWLTPWLQGFVEVHGTELATTLLQEYTAVE